MARPGAVATIGPPMVDLVAIKRASNLRQFDLAATLLERAIDADPASVKALTLMGVLQESRGQDHAAYHAYRAALEIDPESVPARDNLRRYCEQFGLDFASPAINPAAQRITWYDDV